MKSHRFFQYHYFIPYLKTYKYWWAASNKKTEIPRSILKENNYLKIQQFPDTINTKEHLFRMQSILSWANFFPKFLQGKKTNPEVKITVCQDHLCKWNISGALLPILSFFDSSFFIDKKNSIPKKGTLLKLSGEKIRVYFLYRFLPT